MDLPAPRVSAVAALIADPARARMLTALMSGEAMTATELALHGRVTPQTASFHFAALREAGLVNARKHGRSRYYLLASPAVAAAIEALQVLAADGVHPGWRPGLGDEPIRVARTCYDHLAGRLGVEITESLVRNGYLRRTDRDFRLTRTGARFFQRLGIDTERVRKLNRKFARQCLDWTERRAHLAGGLGAALASRSFELGWFCRMPSTRALTVTREGERQLGRLLAVGYRLPANRPEVRKRAGRE